MSGERPSVWSARLDIRCADAGFAEALTRTLGPEVAREVPRARATLDAGGPTTVRLTIAAADTGAMRAATNTFLGWVQLAVATRRAASR